MRALLRPVLLASLTLGVLAPPVPAASLHVMVEEKTAGGDHVDVTVPLGLAQAALAFVPHDAVHLGNVDVNGKTMKVHDLRALWAEAKKSGNGDLVNIVDADQTVRVGVRDGQIRVRVTSKSDGNVALDLPTSVVDALLSGDGDQLDVGAGLAALQSARIGDLVRIDDGDSHVVVRVE